MGINSRRREGRGRKGGGGGHTLAAAMRTDKLGQIYKQYYTQQWRYSSSSLLSFSPSLSFPFSFLPPPSLPLRPALLHTTVTRPNTYYTLGVESSCDDTAMAIVDNHGYVIVIFMYSISMLIILFIVLRLVVHLMFSVFSVPSSPRAQQVNGIYLLNMEG